MNDWYESVDENATPDVVFWEEMERQRLFNQISDTGNNDGGGGGGVDDISSSSSRQVAMTSALAATSGATKPPLSRSNNNNNNNLVGAGMGSVSSSSSGVAMGGTARLTDAMSRKPPTMDQQKSAEATLSEYTLYQVADNWLDEDLQEYFDTMRFEEPDEGLSLEEETQRLQEQLESLPDGIRPISSNYALEDQGEPWESWGVETDETVDLDRANVKQVQAPPKDSEFYLDDDPIDPDVVVADEKAFWDQMSSCQTTSRRLERAAVSPRAKDFFQRPPDVQEGYDRMWVSAIDNVCFKSIIGNLRNYGIQFADNFGDWQDGCAQDGLYSIEDMASFKARKVYEVTGLPCIASRTSFEIEPIPEEPSQPPPMPGTKATSAATGVNNPKVLSGYRINDIGNHVDYLVEALTPLSEPTRVTRFTSCMCYYDGEVEIFEYGVLDADIFFSSSRRTFIPMAQALNGMIETLKLTFGLEYQKFLRSKMNQVTSAGYGTGSTKLRDRVLKDGKVLPNDIIDVSQFMDSQVDVNLMDECAKELANRFMSQKPTKIMTVATTGLVIALPMAKYLQVPVVYARKERNIVMADTYKAAFSSKTAGKNRELLVSKSHLHAEDRVLVVDDFLSSGASQEALLRIISDADATAVGVGVLLEKSYESGRQSLSGFNIPIHSLCRVASVQDGSIQLLEEVGYEQK